MRHPRGAILTVLLAVASCMAPATTPEVRLEPIAVPAPGDGPLTPTAFLAGCWRGTFLDGATVIEERWTEPEGGLVLGTTRYFRAGRAVDFEFSLLRADAEGPFLLPHPRGSASEHPFRLTAHGPGELVFEAPEHDYPTRILYTRTGDRLEARIDGGADDAEPRRWTLQRVECGA